MVRNVLWVFLEAWVFSIDWLHVNEKRCDLCHEYNSVLFGADSEIILSFMANVFG